MLNNKLNYQLTGFQGNLVSKQFPGPLDLLFLTYSHFSPTAKEAGRHHRKISSVPTQTKTLPKQLPNEYILIFWNDNSQSRKRKKNLCSYSPQMSCTLGRNTFRPQWTWLKNSFNIGYVLLNTIKTHRGLSRWLYLHSS